MSSTINGQVSHWFTELPSPRPALPGDRDADVCIVGAGYTGLWTAYYLLKADPSLRITVLEERFAGFGASGRNGGWLSGLAPGHRGLLAKRHGRADSDRLVGAWTVHMISGGARASARCRWRPTGPGRPGGSRRPGRWRP